MFFMVKYHYIKRKWVFFMLTQEDLQAISLLIKNEVEPLYKKFDNVESRLDNVDSRLDNVDSRLDKVDSRLDKVESRLDKVDSRLDNIDSRLDKIEETLEEVKEDGQITRDVTNSIGEWIEFYFGKEKPFPLDKDEINEQEKILKMFD